MRESRTYGSVRGALREKRSYRDLDLRFPFVRFPILNADSSSMLMPSPKSSGKPSPQTTHCPVLTFPCQTRKICLLKEKLA